MMKTVRILPALLVGALALGGCAENTLAPAAEASALVPAGTPSADRARPGTDPIARILRRSDELSLTADQVARLTTIQERLAAEVEPLQSQVRAALGDRPARGQRGTPPAAAEREAMRARMAQVRPVMEQIRTLHQAALAEARTVLTPDQQARLESGRRDGMRGNRDPRGAAVRGGMGGGPGGPGGGVAVLLRRAEALGLSADQVARLEAIQTRLAAQNAPLQEQVRAIVGGARPGGRDRTGPPTAAEREAMRARVEQARPLMEQIRDNAAAAREEALSVLTEEQRARVREARPGRGAPGEPPADRGPRGRRG